MTSRARNQHRWGVVGSLFVDGQVRDVEHCEACGRYRAGERTFSRATLDALGAEWL